MVKQRQIIISVNVMCPLVPGSHFQPCPCSVETVIRLIGTRGLNELSPQIAGLSNELDEEEINLRTMLIFWAAAQAGADNGDCLLEVFQANATDA